MAYLSKQEAKQRTAFSHWEARQMMELHVFRGEVDWVVAHDVEDAWAVFAGYMGESSIESAKEEYPQDWEQLDDDKMLYVWFDSPTGGVCLCDERKAEQVLARERWGKRVHDMTQGEPGTHIWCLTIRIAKHIVPERKVTCGSNGHYKGCHRGWPGKTCKQWAHEVGRDLLSSTEV